MVDKAVEVGLEAPRDRENAPSDPPGVIEIGGSPLLPSFSEEMIQEARALKFPSIEGAHRKEDPFRDYFTGLKDATGLSNLEVPRKDSGEASSLFNEAQQALNQASTLHWEAFSRSRAELSQYEADIQRLTKERNSLNLLGGQKEENIKDLRAELATAHKDQTDLIEQVERIEQFREEVNMMKAETLGWKESMVRFAAKKEAARAQLSSVESQLRGMKDKSSAQAKQIKELEARLAFELAKAKSDAEKAKAKAKAIMAIYRSGAEAAQVQAREEAQTAQTLAHWIAELAKYQSRREILEEIHARGFDLTEEIIKDRENEADAGALASSDDDNDDGSKSGSESKEDLDGEEDAPEEN
ncbi:uncharacterized protein [Nicotiana tomentosiformis]|uniref:uncharacterized protein n=1 Tax=Nicotiana tomentosiformis TaxID=4098 RepID=UPI00388C9C50